MTGTFSPPTARGTGGPSRCRRCGARVGHGDDWCSLCLTPVVAPGDACVDTSGGAPVEHSGGPTATPPGPTAALTTPTAAPITPPGPAPVENSDSVGNFDNAGNPEGAERAGSAAGIGQDATLEPDQAARMLAGLARQEHGGDDPSAFTVARAHLALAEVPGGKYMLALGGALLLLALLMVGLTLLGMVV